MFTKTALALAAIGAVSASPLAKRQETASSAVSAVSSAAVSATSATLISAASSSIASAAITTSAPAATASTTNSTTNSTGGQTYPAYPCPAGTLLTYLALNQTFNVSVNTLTTAAGEFATSPFFPNVTAGTGGSTVGATHTINIAAAGISIPEVLVAEITNATSGYLRWVWNNTASASALGLTLANYSSVLSLYDPDYPTTGTIGNTSIAVLFTNACVSDQSQGQTLLNTLGNLELGNLGTAVGSTGSSNSTSAATTTAGASSTMISSMASTMATSAVSGASSAATAATSVPASAVSAATGAAVSALSSVAA